MTGSIKDYTPNYKFIIPRFDLATWHDYIESNFRSIDALLYNIFVVNGYKGEWTNSTLYKVGSVVFIGEGNGDFTGKLFKVLVQHTTPNSGNFKTFYENNPNKYEQFADFDAAERAAQLAKDWANKLGSTVDGLEYSSKYYAQLAQQTVNSKANDDEVIHLSGDETITGLKTFTSNVRVSKTVPCVDLYNTNITKGTVPSSSQWGRNAMVDKDGKLIAITQYYYNTAGETYAGIRAYSPNNETDYAQISIWYPPTGSPYTYAPTPTTTTETNHKHIATTGWVNSVGNNVVHLTDSETIAGTKTFSSTISGSINGNAATVTNGVYTTGNQTIGGTKTFSAVAYGTSSDADNSILTTVEEGTANNGWYAKLGNGWMIEQGIVTANNQALTITLPKAFKSATSYSAVGTCNNAKAAYVTTQASSTFKLDASGGIGGTTIRWVAIGKWK